MRRLSTAGVFVGAALCVAGPVAAQVGETRVAIVVSPTFLDFAGFGGGFGAAAAQVRVTRYFTATAGGEISTFAVLPMGGASAQPSCAPGAAACQARRTPSLLHGGLVSLLGDFGETGFRGSIGAGAAQAIDMEGPGAHSSLVGSFGLEWVPSGKSRLTPTFSIRALQLASPIAGLRQMLLPGVGLTF